MVVAQQLALLALVFAACFEQVRAECPAIQVDSGKVAALVVVEGQAVVVRQAQGFELAAVVVAITQGAPALVLGGQAALRVVFVLQRPVAVVDAKQIAEAVVGVIHRAAIGQVFSDEAAGVIVLVGGNQLTVIVAKLGFFLQVAVEVVDVGGALAVEAGFLLDQAVSVVLQLIALTCLVFDLGQQQASVVVAIAQGRAIGVDPATDQVQAIGIFIPGHTPQFIALGGDFSVGVVAQFAGGTARHYHLDQPTHRVPVILGQGAMFILAGNLPAQVVIAITPYAAIGQLLPNQLAKIVPRQALAAVVRVPNR
ncbi:hypothetical protein PSFL_32050 [Pseudomonas sp. DD1]